MLKVSLLDFARYRYPALKIHAGYIAIGYKAQLVEVNGSRYLSVFGRGSGIMSTAGRIKIKDSHIDAWTKAASVFGAVVVQGNLEGPYHKAKIANHNPTSIWELLCVLQPACCLSQRKTSRLYLSEQYERVVRDNPDKLIVAWEKADYGAGAIWIFGKRAEMKPFARLSIDGSLALETPVVADGGFSAYKVEIDKDIVIGGSNIIRFYDCEIVCGSYIRWEDNNSGYMLAYINGDGFARKDQSNRPLEKGWYLFVRSLDFLKGGCYADGNCKTLSW